MIKKFFQNTIVKCALILVASVFLGFGLLNIVYSIPMSGGGNGKEYAGNCENIS